jgi:pyruvate/2-oxoglutarate dehydrogenase complex dihydrolipoamide dehydrogenase (E3) component
VIEARTVVVNTGSVPRLPDFEGVDGPRVYDSTALQHVDPLPKRLLVVGGGYVGLEFAGMFTHFGSQVTLVDHHEELMPREDRDVADAVQVLLEEQGVEIVRGTSVTALHHDADVVRASLSTSGTREGDGVLSATGRRPATEDLGLDVAGIKTDDRGYIDVDEHLRTSAPGVYAVGDVNGGPQFTYISLDDYRIVLDQHVGTGRRSTRDRVAVPSTTFLDPPLARVGLDEREATERGIAYLVASEPVAQVAAMPRPKIVGQPRGLLKVLVDPETDLILGATLLCVDAQEVINLIALAMRTGTTATQLRDGIWTHPSATEGLNEGLAAFRD